MESCTCTMEYTPLDHVSREIRLLILEPSAYMITGIRVRLIHSRLGQGRLRSTIDDKPACYSALSYVWGDPKVTKLITVINSTNPEGQEVAVTTNLESALRHLRWEKQERTLWVDRLCIHQDDTAERNPQVQLMTSIYENAYDVIVWLGEATLASTRGMRFINDHVKFSQVSNVEQVVDHGPMLATVNDPEGVLAWIAIGQDLMKRPWWDRIWVVQEISCATRAIVCCGKAEVTWDKLVAAGEFARSELLYIFGRTAEEVDQGEVFFPNYREKAIYRRRHFLRQPIKLLELLENNVRCKSHDPRDYIFALLGLATDVDETSFTADYQQSVVEVYTRFAKYIIERDKSLDIICMSRNKKAHDDLPSWVPDWSNLWQTTSTALASFSSPLSPLIDMYDYQAAGKRSVCYKFSEKGNKLSVRGICGAVVETLGDVCDHQNFGEAVARWKYLALGTTFERRSDAYVRGGNIWDAFNRTICADKGLAGEKSTAGRRGTDIDFARGADSHDDSLPGKEGPEEAQLKWAERLIRRIFLVSTRRRFFISGNKYMGLAPPDTRKGDWICVLSGCSVPVVVREEDDHYRFIGESYVDGMMDGEMINALTEGEVTERDFVLW